MSDTSTNVIDLAARRACEKIAAIAVQPAHQDKGWITREEAAESERERDALKRRVAFLEDRLSQIEAANRRLRGDNADMFSRLANCTCGKTHPVIDLVKHDELPSRANPFASAAAVRIVSEKREVL